MLDVKRPLKILQVASGLSGWGGIESHVIALSLALRAHGHDVSIACRPDCYVACEAKKHHLLIVPLICRKKQDWGAASSFRKVYERERYDVVHIHGGADHVVPAAIAKRCGVPAVIMTRHTSKRVNYISRLLYGTYLYHHIIAVAEYVRGVLVGSGIDSSRVTTIHHGTDPLQFSVDRVTIPAATVRGEWGIGEEAPLVVGFAGRFVAEKGGDILLRALAKVPESVGVFIGDGPLKEEWQRLGKELGISPSRLVWAGFRSDIHNALNAVDAFVLPSVWAEPCAAVVQQAMALEKPVIGTRLGGTPEMIVSGETGYLVDAGDVEGLSGALCALSSRSDLDRLSMGRRGRERVVSCFSLSGMAQHTEALYDRLVSTRVAIHRP